MQDIFVQYFRLASLKRKRSLREVVSWKATVWQKSDTALDIITVYRNRLWVYEKEILGPLLPPHVTMSIGTINLCFGLTFDFIKLPKWTDSTLSLLSPSFSLQAAEQIIHKKDLAPVCTQSVWRGNGMLLQPRVYNVHRLIYTTETTITCLDYKK